MEVVGLLVVDEKVKLTKDELETSKLGYSSLLVVELVYSGVEYS